MAQFTSPIGPAGALLPVVVSVSAPRLAALTLANVTAPPPALAMLVIDTGATLTQIDQTIINGLGLDSDPTGSLPILTPSSGTTAVNMNTYDVGLAAMDLGGVIYRLATLPVLSGDFSAHGHSGVLGRDVLAAGRLMYSGPDKFVLLSLP